VTARDRSRRHDANLRWLLPVAWCLALAAFIVACGLPSAYAVPHYSQRYTRAAIRSEAHTAGYGHAQSDALVHLAYHESRWHNWSSNHGHFLGAFQLKWTMCRNKPWWNPHWNTYRAIIYIKHRYGTPVRALAFSHRNGWY
jgi:hypothetical protein